MKEENPRKDGWKEIKFSVPVHARMLKEARECKLSNKDYVEAAIMFFASRKLNPKSVKEGEEYKLLDAFHKGIDRIIRIIIRQEKDKVDLMLENLKGILHEQVNARVLTEVMINNLHRLSELDREELKQIIQQNSQYAMQRKKDILKVYRNTAEEKK